MPTYNLRCGGCGHEYESMLGVKECACKAPCPKCGLRKGRKLFTPSGNFVIPGYMKAENADATERHRAWFNSPEVAARRDRGELQREGE